MLKKVLWVVIPAVLLVGGAVLFISMGSKPTAVVRPSPTLTVATTSPTLAPSPTPTQTVSPTATPSPKPTLRTGDLAPGAKPPSGASSAEEVQAYNALSWLVYDFPRTYNSVPSGVRQSWSASSQLTVENVTTETRRLDQALGTLPDKTRTRQILEESLKAGNSWSPEVKRYFGDHLAKLEQLVSLLR